MGWTMQCLAWAVPSTHSTRGLNEYSSMTKPAQNGMKCNVRARLGARTQWDKAGLEMALRNCLGHLTCHNQFVGSVMSYLQKC